MILGSNILTYIELEIRKLNKEISKKVQKSEEKESKALLTFKNSKDHMLEE